MESKFGLSLPLLILGALVILAAFSGRHRRRRMMRPCQPRHSYLIVRILCVVVGIGIFAAVGYATISDARDRYKRIDSGPEVRVPLPDRILSPASAPLGAEDRAGKLFLYIVAARIVGGTGVPVNVQTVVLDWPRDRGKVVEHSFEEERSRFNVSVTPLALLREVRSSGSAPASPTLILHASSTWNITAAKYRGQFPTTGLYNLSGDGMAGIHPYLPTFRVLSLLASPERRLELWCVGVLAAPDSTVSEVPFSTLQAQHGPGLYRNSPPRIGPHLSRSRYLSAAATPMRGVALFLMKGMPVVLLACGAALISKWFLRARSVAFTVLVTFAVLYTAALDRATLAIDLGKVKDPTLRVESRLEACENARWTFFYRQTAAKSLQQIAEESNAPDTLREATRRAAAELAG